MEKKVKPTNERKQALNKAQKRKLQRKIKRGNGEKKKKMNHDAIRRDE